MLPPIMNPVYGFEAINVEAQAGDQYSLLNWTRRMLTVRKRHKAFGRGTLRFLYPGNRKVLAYLREYEDETILCVCNVSRVIQAVELDLSASAGRIPVDLTGGSTFPPIGQLPYLLTLPPFALLLVHPVDRRQLAGVAFAGARADGRARDAGPARRHRRGAGPLSRAGVLEEEALPSYLARRRWFASKDEKIGAVRLSMAEPISGAGSI